MQKILLEVSVKPSGKKGGGASSGGPHANGRYQILVCDKVIDNVIS